MRQAGLLGLIVAVVVVVAALAPPGTRAAEKHGLIRVTHHLVRLGPVPVGTYVSRTFHVKNRSGAPISLNTFEVFGTNGDWGLHLPPDCRAGTVLRRGGRCSFTIVVHPVQLGQIRGVFCVTGVVSSTLWQRKCGRIRGYAR